MNRKLRDTLPITAESLVPSVPDQIKVDKSEENRRDRIEKNYNDSKGVRKLSELSPGDPVFIKDSKMHGKVVSKAREPRSYIVETPSNQVRRNRFSLIPMYESRLTKTTEQEGIQEEAPDTQPEVVEAADPYKTTRSGRAVRMPEKYDDYQL